MKKKSHFLSSIILLMLTCLVLFPALGEGKEEFWDEMHKIHRATLVQELKLSPEKAKDFNAIEEMYGKERDELVEGLKKSHVELQNALSAANPDETKIKGLVAAILAGQGKLVQSFESQRDKEFALLTPLQQGKYLMLLHKWREEMMEEHMKLRKK